MESIKSTESDSLYADLESMSLHDLLVNINREDNTVPRSVKKCIPQIERLAQQVILKLSNNGRLFYIGAGTSGRLAILDASECTPTYGLPPEKVTGIIAGGDKAIRKAVEFAEDDTLMGWRDLQQHNINAADIVIGITASGSTPYVVGALQHCLQNRIATGCITCNSKTPVASIAGFPVECIVGAEFVTGSTRMKAGTAQKLILNMISTSAMIVLGKVKGNKMVDMQLTNKKLIDRGTRMLMNELNVDKKIAQLLLKKYGSVRNAIKGEKNT